MTTDIDRFRQAVSHLHPNLTQDEWDYLCGGLVRLTLKPKEFFIQAGKQNHLLGFVASGLVRGYYLNHQGEEVTFYFAKENDYATDYSSLLTQKPSRCYFQCLEPTTLLTLSYQHIQQCYTTHHGLERYGRLIAEETLKMLNARVESFQFDQAEQRYLDFIQHSSDLFNRVSLSHLASYLGIERPSLSRIRKKITGL
ncbi:Crp/Fnr family transcriptional regulator [Spirosoma flavum]|uniref:Crp/Fnr family transcriptional regulator n=1 Tax=Spirosoma flavum TaxID=2048557 RepID=A0ABW6ATM8_9BACT